MALFFCLHMLIMQIVLVGQWPVWLSSAIVLSASWNYARVGTEKWATKSQDWKMRDQIHFLTSVKKFKKRLSAHSPTVYNTLLHICNIHKQEILLDPLGRELDPEGRELDPGGRELDPVGQEWWLRQASKSHFGLLWPWPLTSWPRKSIVSCPCSRGPLVPICIEIGSFFSKYRVQNIQ